MAESKETDEEDKRATEHSVRGQGLGLGQLFESAKSAVKSQSLRNNFNPMIESIKKSFQSILSSSGMLSGRKVAEETKPESRLVAFNEMSLASTDQLQAANRQLLACHPVLQSPDRVLCSETKVTNDMRVGASETS